MASQADASAKSNRSSSKSFSLPSAAGVVSLLNEDGSKQQQHQQQDVQSNDPRRLGVSTDHRKLSRSGNSSTSSSNTPTPSPFDSQPSGSGGESIGGSSAVTSIPPSNSSSRDDSLDSSRAKHDTRRPLSEESDDSSSRQVGNGGNGSGHRDTGGASTVQELRNDLQNADSASISSQSEDGNEAMINAQLNVSDRSPKRRRASDSRADETVQSRKPLMRRMLDHSRLASSPPPMQGQKRSYDESRDDAHSDNEERAPTFSRRELYTGDRTSVPMNMHRATARAHGGFQGLNELDVSAKGGDARDELESDATGQSGVLSSSSRRASNGSQIINGKKRYPCSFPGCDKTFSTSGHAARHNRIHTGSKPYRCTFPGCNASFSRQDNSLQHYRTHVLHPKSRSGGSVNLDASQMDPAALGSELQNLDAETVATVQMGRKALEEGTAIAVVQEFIDGNGRRAEAVQRMVGQARSGRRGSMVAQDSPPNANWPEPLENRRRMSLDNSASYGPSPAHHLYHHPPPPPSHPHSQQGWQTYGATHYSAAGAYPPYGEAFAQPPPPNQYAQAGPSPAMYGAPYGQAPLHQHMQHTSPPLPPPSMSQAGHAYAQYPNHQPHHHHAHPASAPHAGASFVTSSSSPYANRSHSIEAAHPHYGHASEHQNRPHPHHHLPGSSDLDFGARLRRSSESAYTTYQRDSREQSQVSLGQAMPSPYHRQQRLPPPHAEQRDETPYGYDASAYATINAKGHRRSSSAVHSNGFAPHSAYAPTMQNGNAEYAMSRAQYAKEITSPSMSVRSFRSEGQPGPRESHDVGALSLLSDTAMRDGKQATSRLASDFDASPNSSLPKMSLAKPSISKDSAVKDRSINGHRRSRTSTAEMHLVALPSAAASLKLPFSSDRSTNVLTPTPISPLPAEGNMVHKDAQVTAIQQHPLNMGNPPTRRQSGGGLPSMRLHQTHAQY